ERVNEREREREEERERERERGRRETNETERRRERERERERKGGIKREKKGNGEPLESCGPAFTPLPGTLHTPETLFTQQPRRRGSLRSYLLRARLATRC